MERIITIKARILQVPALITLSGPTPLDEGCLKEAAVVS